MEHELIFWVVTCVTGMITFGFLRLMANQAICADLDEVGDL